MPGSIKISVVGEQRSSSYLLKILVGKREYGNIGVEEEFSFPVTSLRENLVIILHSTSGTAASKKELKIKTIAERQVLDVTFLLDDGREILFRLQFVLSEEEFDRIRHMRSSALKRKQEILSKINHKYVHPSSSTDGTQESKRTAPRRAETSTGKPEKLLRSLPWHGSEETSLSSNSTIGRPSLRTFRSSTVENTLSIIPVFNPLDSSSSSAVKKMISALEGNSSQVLEMSADLQTESPITKVEGHRGTYQRAEQSASSVRTMAMTYSAQSSSENNVQKYYNVQQNSNPVTYSKASITSEQTKHGPSEILERGSLSVDDDILSGTEKAKSEHLKSSDGVCSNDEKNVESKHDDQTENQESGNLLCSTSHAEDTEPSRSNYILAISELTSCSFQLYDAMAWRHLCVTTGSRQLVDFIGQFSSPTNSALAERIPVGSIADEKLSLPEFSSSEAGTNDTMSKRSGETPPPLGLSLDARLLNQGLQVAIFVIACCAILLKRQ